MPTKKRLGRGLETLIEKGIHIDKPSKNRPNDKPAAPPPTKTLSRLKTGAKTKLPASKSTALEKGFAEIAVAHVRPNRYQPRKNHPETIGELADSIRAEGLLQPIVVRKVGEGYELIAGERRWRAFQHLRLKKIPARIIAANDASSATIALIENLQREDLNPIEEAMGFASLMRDFDLTQEAVAERVGKKRTTITNALRLLQLDRTIQDYLVQSLISVGHAKVLLGLESDSQRLMLARTIIEKDLSVRESEYAVNRLKTHRAPRADSRAALSKTEWVVLHDLEKRLTSELNAKVSLKHSPKKGKMIIEYQGNEDLHRILEKIGIMT